jgi:phage host-nuclease inhibitor protein Gam
MDKLRQPRTVEQATALCEKLAELEGQIAEIEAGRQESIAAINARADTAANDLIAQRDAIAGKLEPWWKKAGQALLDGKRKSIELGGCIIGTGATRKSLQIPTDEATTIEGMRKLRWAAPFLRQKWSIDRAATLKALDGKHRDKLTALGFGKAGGEDRFFVKRAEQEGTRSGR